MCYVTLYCFTVCALLITSASIPFSVLLAVMAAITSIGAWNWLTDPKTAVVPLTESLLNHYIFVIATFILCKCRIHWELPPDAIYKYSNSSILLVFISSISFRYWYPQIGDSATNFNIANATGSQRFQYVVRWHWKTNFKAKTNNIVFSRI